MDADQCFLIPFYEYMKTIIGVTALKLKTGNCSDKHFEFRGNFNTEFSLNFDNNLLLTESRKHKSNRFDIRLVMRICKTPNKTYSMHKKTNSMVDCFPLNLKLCINDQPVQLSSYLPYDRCRRPGRMNPRLIDITDLILDSSNCNPHTFNIHWVQDNIRKQFNFALYLVRRRSYDELSSILMKYRIFSVQNTINLFSERIIIHPVNNKSNIDYMFQDRKVLNTSLICPLSLSRMKIPVRGGNCTHLKCFDLMSYLIINFKKPTWTCPICDKKAFFCLLKIDGLIYSIINDKRSNLIDEIEFNENGQWKFYDEVPDENSDTDKFYDIPENYCSLKINNEQLINGSKTQKCSETVSGVELNKDLKNILPISDWLSLKNEFISSNGTNIVASLETSTLSNGSNSKSSPVQTLSSKKSSISNSNSTNTPINSKTRVFQENRHQTNLTPNSNNNTNNNNLKRTHLNSSSESGNEKEIPVKKLICDSSSLPKVNVSKTIEESAHNDESLNKESDKQRSQSQQSRPSEGSQNTSIQIKYNIDKTHKINMQSEPSTSKTQNKNIHPKQNTGTSTPDQQSIQNKSQANKTNTIPHYTTSMQKNFYGAIQDFSFRDNNKEPRTETFTNIIKIPNALKSNTFDRDLTIIKFTEARRYILRELTGYIEVVKDTEKAVREGKRVARQVRIHITRTAIKFKYLGNDIDIMKNSSLFLEELWTDSVNSAQVAIQNIPAVICIEIVYYDTMPTPFPAFKSIRGHCRIEDTSLMNNVSFMKYDILTAEDIRQMSVFVDMKTALDYHQCPQILEITILNQNGEMLLNEKTCPREKIQYFNKHVTGHDQETIKEGKDSYKIILMARQILYGKIIIGYDLGRNLAALQIDSDHIVGYRDLNERKWGELYHCNQRRGKTQFRELFKNIFKNVYNPENKMIINEAKKMAKVNTERRIKWIRMMFIQICKQGLWNDTIKPTKTYHLDPRLLGLQIDTQL